MTRAGLDPKSTAGADMPIERHVPLAVVGAGPAGLAAAIAAAKAGIEVLLVDEKPVAQALMGLDVPLHFGGRIHPTVQKPPRTVAEAFELGIDVQLGVYAWGAFSRGPSLRSIPKPVLGLADEQRSWLVSFDRLILATGARDLGVSFAGWEKPGVMGGQAALSLMERYRAFDGRRLLILGSGALGMRVAGVALEQRLEVAGVVDVGRDPLGPDVLRPPLSRARVPFFGGHAVKQVIGKAEVEGVRLVGVDAAGCTSVPSVHAVGDCAGIYDKKIADPAIAMAEGRHAGIAAARALGARHEAGDAVAIPAPTFDSFGHWRRW